MKQFIAASEVKLAPHGKTAMAPRLFDRQLQAGSWGITLATAHQILVAYTRGVRRALMVNQLIGKENIPIIGHLVCDPAFEYYCLVDSATQIDQLGELYSKRVQRLRLLPKLGVAGGRVGVRNETQLQPVLATLSRWLDSIALHGIDIYEGVLDSEVSIRAFLQYAAVVTRRLAADKRFDRDPILLSGAGSV